MMTERTLKFHWKDYRPRILKFWTNVTEEELEKTKGSLTSVAGLIHQKYGDKREYILIQLEQLCNEATGSNFTEV